ncbi:MAG: hypothetical protein ACLUIQ_02210 [Dialister invisus]
MKEIAILGSTGSIGTQTLDIVRIYPRLFHVAVISAKRNIDALFAQAEEFHPHTIVRRMKKQEKGLKTFTGDRRRCCGKERYRRLPVESSGSCPCFRGRH